MTRWRGYERLDGTRIERPGPRKLWSASIKPTGGVKRRPVSASCFRVPGEILRNGAQRFHDLNSPMPDLKEQATKIFFDTLRQIDIASVVNKIVKVEDGVLDLAGTRIDLSRYGRVAVIGIGKASIPMGAAIEALLGPRFTRGILVSDRHHTLQVRSEVLVGGHPLPDANSLEAARRIVDLINSCGSETLLIFLVSGGGSALVEMPLRPDVSLKDIRDLNQILINSGATIEEINIIRKHLSAVKGGRLGYLGRASTCVGLYVSDVNYQDLRSIASNPMLPDRATIDDFFSVLERYNLTERLPVSIASLIRERSLLGLPQDWRDGKTAELNLLLLHSRDAIEASARSANGQGLRVEIESGYEEGDYRYVADMLVERLIELHRKYPDDGVCLVSGGEVSCAVVGGGLGGRNQHFVLYCAARLAELDPSVDAAVLCCGTDGIDGNSNAAGAVASTDLAGAARAQGLEISPFIQGFDSHSFFRQLGGLVFTGPSGNNVRDLRILLARRRQ